MLIITPIINPYPKSGCNFGNTNKGVLAKYGIINKKLKVMKRLINKRSIFFLFLENLNSKLCFRHLFNCNKSSIKLHSIRPKIEYLKYNS